MYELEHPLRARQITQPDLSQLQQPDTIPQVVTRQVSRRLGDHDLAAVRHAQQPCSTVHRRAEVVIVAKLCHSRVKSHAHPERLAHRPVLAADRSLAVDGRAQRGVRGCEHSMYAVASTLHNLTAVSRDRFPQDHVMARQRHAHRMRLLLPQPRRNLEIGEQERHRPRRADPTIPYASRDSPTEVNQPIRCLVIPSKAHRKQHGPLAIAPEPAICRRTRRPGRLRTTRARAAGLRVATSGATFRFAVLRVPPVASRGRVILATFALATAVVGCGVLSGRTYQMDTLDMAPNIPRGTLVSLQSENSIHRGDIVAMSPPSFLKLHGVNYLLRRVIGLPGETIRGRDGHIVINGRALAEPYLRRGTISPSFQGRRVPAGHYFVLGDNRRTELDSRRFGPVPRSTIVGRVSL